MELCDVCDDDNLARFACGKCRHFFACSSRCAAAGHECFELDSAEEDDVARDINEGVPVKSRARFYGHQHAPLVLASVPVCDVCELPAKLACPSCHGAFYCSAKCEVLDTTHEIGECAHHEDMSESELAGEIQLARQLLERDGEKVDANIGVEELMARAYGIGADEGGVGPKKKKTLWQKARRIFRRKKGKGKTKRRGLFRRRKSRRGTRVTKREGRKGRRLMRKQGREAEERQEEILRNQERLLRAMEERNTRV